MTKRHNALKTIYAINDKVTSMDKIKVTYSKLYHTDKITIDKLQYVATEALYMSRDDKLCQMIANKHLSNIKHYCCIGEYSINQNKICLFSDGLEYFMEISKNTLEEQIARTISHEIMHRVLFYEQGEHTTRSFDNIAEKLRIYGVW